MSSVVKIKEEIIKHGGVSQGCHYVFTIVPPRVFGASNVLGIVDDIKNGSLSVSGILDQARRGAIQLVLGQAGHISMLAESVSLPGRQLLTTEHRLFGTVRKMPYGVLYEDFTVTFICTNSMVERSFFDIWHQLIMASGSQYMEFYDDYVGTLIVQKVNNSTADNGLISKIGQMASKYKLLEAYPVSIQSQELNYADGEYLKLTVQFSYAKWQTTFEGILTNEPNLPWIGQFPLSTEPGGISGSLTRTADGDPATGGAASGVGTGGAQPGIGKGGEVNPTIGAGGTTQTPVVPATANPGGGGPILV